MSQTAGWRVLLVEDEPLMRARLRAALLTGSAVHSVAQAGTLADARAILAGASFDLLLVDLGAGWT